MFKVKSLLKGLDPDKGIFGCLFNFSLSMVYITEQIPVIITLGIWRPNFKPSLSMLVWRLEVKTGILDKKWYDE